MTPYTPRRARLCYSHVGEYPGAGARLSCTTLLSHAQRLSFVLSCTGSMLQGKLSVVIGGHVKLAISVGCRLISEGGMHNLAGELKDKKSKAAEFSRFRPPHLLAWDRQTAGIEMPSWLSLRCNEARQIFQEQNKVRLLGRLLYRFMLDSVAECVLRLENVEQWTDAFFQKLGQVNVIEESG